MSKIIAASAIRGAHDIVTQAEGMVAQVLAAKGAEHPVGFPDTAYSLPVIYSLLGQRVDRVGDLPKVLEECRTLLPPAPAEKTWLPYLGNALDAGVATLFAFEILEACKYLIGPPPVQGLWLGAASDVIIRERGIEFVDGSAPGFAAVVGAAPDPAAAVRIARELQEKNLYVFMAGHTHGVSFAEQLAEAGVELGWETRLVPYGKEISAAIYALGFANRVALSFGGVQPGDYARNLRYNKNRVFAFVLALGEVTEEKYAAAAGAISYGFPTIADTDIPQILPTGICTYEHVVSSVPLERIVEKALEVRGCKVKISKVPIPVAYGPAFEGERIRKEQTHVEFGGNRTPAFEFVTTRELAEVEDGKIRVVGPEAEDVEAGGALPLAIWVEVAGRKMQPDFEPILERQIHHLVNGGEGIWHMGQRDIIWIRISKAAKDQGFTIRHLGVILHAKFLNEYPAIVDKVQVTLYTDPAEVQARISHARQVYRARNQRLESLTDESVDTFYSCLLCQSFAPNHVCVITPERLGLCGAYNWLDGKAAYEIDPTGPNQPLAKGECLDPVRGQWAAINDYVYANSKQTIRSFNAYSMMEHPMTSCGCFEAIVGVLPECNGVMIVNREYTGDTPAGMRFSTLANVAGGGQQTPGMIGVGKAYIASRKFISAEGGHRRIVWMPRELKEALREDLGRVAERLGLNGFLDMIADESVGTDVRAVRAHLERVHHPALSLWDITGPSPEAAEADRTRAASSGQAEAPAPAPVQAEEARVPAEVPPAPAPVVLPPAPLAFPAAVAEARVPQDGASRQAAPPGGLESILATLEKARILPLPPPLDPSLPPEQQLAALQVSTAMNLLAAGANMLLMAGLSAPKAAPAPPAAGPVAAEPEAAPPPPVVARPAASGPAPLPRPVEAAPVVEAPPAERPVAPAVILAPTSFSVPPEKVTVTIRTVTLGGTGTRTSAVTIGGAAALPFRHFEGDTGRPPAIAMEVFDAAPRGYPDSLRRAYGALLADPAAMARYCVETLGADLISVRLAGTHPDHGDRSPEEAAAVVGGVLKAVGVPIIVTGPSHYEKNNAVMKHVAAAFAGENLLLSWAETDNYKTIAAAALGYSHCLVAQSPIDVNMAKQLNILLTNMGVPADRIVMDPLTGAIGYGLEYTYSVMERSRTAAFTGDPMLAMPILGTPGYEVARTKESRAPRQAFPLWGPEEERGALLEIATAMSLLNAGADLLILYHPLAATTVKRKIVEMTRLGA
jgi:acetyl-CoA synthase